MTEATDGTQGQRAILALPDSSRVSGRVSALPDGRLQLSSPRLARRPATGGRPDLQPGREGRLLFEPVAGEDNEHRVLVDSIANRTILLRFLHPDADATRRRLAHLAASAAQPPEAAGQGEYAQLLRLLRADCLKQLDRQLKAFLPEVANHLFDISTQVRHSSTQKNIFYDATVLIRRNAGRMTAAVLDQVSGLFQDLTPERAESGNGVEGDEADLDLVDTGEFESDLAIERMITRGEDLHALPLEALTIRLASLIDADPDRVRLPVHVRPLSRILQRVFEAQQLPPAVVLRVFDYFTREFVEELGDFYTSLNAALAREGVRPGLEEEIRSKGSLLRRARPRRPVVREAPAGARPAQPAPAPEPEPPPVARAAPAASPQAKYDNIYRSVIDALNFRREAEGLATPGAQSGGTAAASTWQGTAVGEGELDPQQLASAGDIAQALGALQRDAAVRAAVEAGTSLREYLARNKEQLERLRDKAGLTAESLNQLDLVDNLFGTLKSQVDLTSELKPALGELHIPLAKLALLDPRFFLDQNHPARAMVDRLAQLAATANFPNKALENRITDIVGKIVSDYEHDSSVFDNALAQIDKLVAQQERALSRNVERVVRVQEGQEKLHKAQQAVQRVIADRLAPPRAPGLLKALVDNGWRDLLVLTHIKEGPDSTAWREHLQTLDQLQLWLTEQDQGEVGQELQLQRGLEAGTLLDMIGQQIASALPTNVSHQQVLEELRETLAGNRPVEFIEIEPEAAPAPSAPAALRARIEDLPRLRRWIMRVEQLENGTWLTYRDRDGKKRRMQLAWTSEERDRYIFVNERGQKVADLSAIQLARQLSKGVQPPTPVDRLTVVDQSLYQTLEHVQKTLSFARNHDSLTRLINRETFLDQLQRALRHAQRKHAQHALLLLNVDQFNLVNEVYDRSHGDQVLLEFARLLAQLHGKKSSSARLEADSFAVLLLDRSGDQAMQVAEKIRRDIEASSVEIDGERIGFTVSIGAIPITEFSPEVPQLIGAAKATMYRAKELGRNQVVLYEEDQAAASRYLSDKQRVRRDLEQAVATDRFVLQAQPIVQTHIPTGEAGSPHYELLLGLRNREGGLSSPEEFILSAERYGFMTLVDRWVVREAFSWISRLMDEQKVVPDLSINLSGTSVTDDSFMDYLFEQISEFGVGTSHICFEITETGTISNLVKAADFVRAFRNIGCKFSIDDFGTGLASHNYLRELPVDYVKIDGSFITNIHRNRSDYAIARSINDLAHFLGQETIAESVENDAIIARLREIGVDYLQGWGVARPKPLAEVTEDLSSIEK